MESTVKTIWIATGGTGGHIFPALAVAEELVKTGQFVHISTDRRGKKYVRDFCRAHPGAADYSIIWASGVGAKGIIKQVFSLFKIMVSTLFLMARFIFRRPSKIVAFGGYSSVPPLVAGWVWRIPTLLHEQNAAIGRANKFALSFVETLMTSFPLGIGVYTGLPVRDHILSTVYEPAKDEIRLLVTGGSLGAKILDDVMPDAVAMLKNRKKLFVTHLSRPENMEKLRKKYSAIGVRNNVATFIRDMAGELSRATLAISRAGASTVVEMQTIGVPAILVPLTVNPDQVANAAAFVKNGGGIILEQKGLTPEIMAGALEGLLSNRENLAKMAEAARVPNNAVKQIVKIVLNS